ncbi:MAG: FtsX-like permease family protein, partial [Gemmatimonadetes bacterium]|nr:FtsX-like permease family protein [Gemmatimonadota bacterium]NIR81358.1 FtsX-like permease family protein [Gemmatimonadota bacterium]NIT90191.1 FtsX-like permease family protein [Gemmatimonadota bacterium]NIU34018.1 FtsX-like permease family protein [Gemmatimonadota bacterium]NIU38183.1 FtsX-like permease family protein [Gemmatimonadota bacterium]
MRKKRDDPRVPGEALYRLLLCLHPREFRRRYRRDMVELFRDAWRDRARGRGAVALIRFWLGITVGTAWSAARQRWSGGRKGAETAAGQGRPPRSGGRRNDPNGRDGEGTMKTWTQDVRYAARTLIKRTGFTAVVVLTLALGIGANTAVFSVLHAVLLAPLPYEEPGRLVRIYETRTDDPAFRNYLPAAAFVDLRESLTTAAGIAVLYNYQQETADLTDGDRPVRVTVLPVSREYFGVVGEEPVLGRTFRRAEEDGSARVAIVSRRIFRAYLGGDADALGSSLTLDGEAYTVAGVMPEGYEDPLQGSIDVFTPVELDLEGGDAWGNHYLTGLARLRPGATVDQLRSELEAAAERVRSPSTDEDLAYAAVPLRDDLVGGADTTLWLLMGAVGLVFLIACVNVAGVTLARGSARRRELAIRSALGSGRGRLVRQLLTESGLLALLGGAAGLALGAGVVRGLVALAPQDLPRLDEASLNGSVFLFGLGASLAAVLLFGLLPALRASRTGVEGALREGGRGGGDGGPGRSRARSALVVAEVALALVLLVGAGILVRSFQRLAAVDLVVDAEHVTVFQVNTPAGRYDGDARARFHQEYLRRLEALPGVRSAA